MDYPTLPAGSADSDNFDGSTGYADSDSFNRYQTPGDVSTSLPTRPRPTDFKLRPALPAGDLLADFFEEPLLLPANDLLADFFEDIPSGLDSATAQGVPPGRSNDHSNGQATGRSAAAGSPGGFDLPHDLSDLGLALPSPNGRLIQRFETPAGRHFVNRAPTGQPVAQPAELGPGEGEFELEPESPAYHSMLTAPPAGPLPKGAPAAPGQPRPFTVVNPAEAPTAPHIIGGSPFANLDEEADPEFEDEQDGYPARDGEEAGEDYDEPPGEGWPADSGHHPGVYPKSVRELFLEPTYNPNRRGFRPRRPRPRQAGLIRFRNPRVALAVGVVSALMLLIIVALIAYLTGFAFKAPVEKFVVQFNTFGEGPGYSYADTGSQPWGKAFGANLLETGGVGNLEVNYSGDNIGDTATATKTARQRADDILVWGYHDSKTNRLALTLSLQPNGPFDPPTGQGRQLVNRYLFDPEQVTLAAALPGDSAANPLPLPLTEYIAALHAYYTGSYETAVAGFTALLNKSPAENEPGLRLLRANALFLSGKYADAVEDYDRLITLNQQAQAQHAPIPVLPASVYNNKAVALNFEGSYPEANRSFELALQNSDKLPRLFANYAQFLLDRTDAEFRPDVLADLQNRLAGALKLDPQSAAILQNLGRIQLYQGDGAGAISTLGKARDLDPNFLEIYYWQGLAYLGQNDQSLGNQSQKKKSLDAALEAFKTGENRVNQRLTQNRRQWQTLDQGGSKTLAAVWDSRARDDQLELEQLRFGIARTYLEMTRLQGKDLGNPFDRLLRWVKGDKTPYEEAGTRLKELLNPKADDPNATFHYGPNNPDANFYYGQFLAITGDGDPSPYYRKAKDLESDLNRRFRYHDLLAKQYAAQGKRQEALNEYTEFIALDKNRAQGYLALSSLEYRFGLFSDAAAAADAAIKITPNDPAAYLAAGVAQEGNLQLQQAVNYFDRALLLDPNLTEAHLQKGLALFNLNRREESLTEFAAALKLNPQTALAHFYIGIVYHENHLDPKAALTEWEQAVQIDPEFAAAWVKLGLVHSQLNELDAAIDAYNKALAINDKDALTHYYLGLLYEGKNTKDDLARAETQYRRAIELQPGMVNAYNHLAAVLVRQGGNSDAALQLAQNAANLDPKNADTQVVLGDLLRGRGNFEQAIAAYNAALALRNAYPEALFGRGAANLGRQQYPAALADVGQALLLKPNWGDALLLRGQIQEALGQYDDANASFGQARLSDPNNPYLYAEMGNLALKRNDANGAIGDYEKSLSLYEPNPGAHFNLAQLYFNRRDFDTALKHFQRTQQLDSGWPRASYWIGRSYEFLNKLNEAQAALEKTVQQEPNFVEGHFELANVYRTQGKRDQALTEYDAALKLQPEYGPAWLNKGQVYEELVKLSEARAAYEKAAASPDPQVRDAATNALKKLGVK
jgi:tetratricopeptide (TPR) repeat protein